MRILVVLLFTLQLFVSAHADCCSHAHENECMTSDADAKGTDTSPSDSETSDCANQCFFKKLYLSKISFNSRPFLTEELYSFWLFQPLASQATIPVILEPPIVS